MWRTVIDELEKEGCVGPGFPVACHRHSDDVHYISEPGVLPRIAPDGSFAVSLIPFGPLTRTFKYP